MSATVLIWTGFTEYSGAMIEGHGDDGYRYGGIKADFSSNVPCGVNHAPLLEYLSGIMDVISHYPEPEPYTFEKEIAAELGIPEGCVLVTNGATEAIYLTAHMLAGKNTAILEPAFREYRDACTIYGHRITGAVALEELSAGGFDSVWLCNPNNPTGKALLPESIMTLAAGNKDTAVVVDQSYEDFTLSPRLLPSEAVAEYPNVIQIHSMTKHFAVPGLRIGYITASEEICRRIRCLRMPWSVNALAVEAGRWLLRHGLSGPSLPSLLSEAARVSAGLVSTGGFYPMPSDTHFMLVTTRYGTAAALKDWLARTQGILIRNADNFHGLSPAHFRIAVQSPAHNDMLINALKQWILLF